MKRLLLQTLVAAASAVSITTFAQGYIGGSFGQSDFKDECTGLSSCDTKDTGFKFFGGYMFNKNFGVEGMYADLGKASGSLAGVTAATEATSFGVYGVGVVPIEQFSLFGKVGLARTEIEASGSGFGVSVNLGSETKTAVAWGLGAGYEFTKNLGIRGEWERFRGEFRGAKGDVDLLSVGVKYTF